jgi:uncharacterized pyridoxamine 5'-phosphate oxidase family protein
VFCKHEKTCGMWENYKCLNDVNLITKCNNLSFLVFSGNLEGKREKRNYKALVEDPQLRFSGLYQRFVWTLILLNVHSHHSVHRYQKTSLSL